MRRRDILASPLFLSAASAASLEPDLREAAARILGAALTDDEGWHRLAHLCDRIGHRLSGSPQLERATAWAAGQMRADGQENVALQPVDVPHWERGEESATMLAPQRKRLLILGLGMTIPTPAGGVEADVVSVKDFDGLAQLARARVEGKIVLYDAPFVTYGQTVRYRSQGPSEAARLGAVACLVRSVTPHSLQTPHTGALRYAEDAPKIPAAAVTVEDASWISRLRAEGVPVRVKLSLGARGRGQAKSANVLGEIVGREKPEEIVVFGGHIDSWDVGQGAHDDGAACVASLQALAVIRKLGLRPRRTLRVALWTNEENGLQGALAYRRQVGDAIGNHAAAIEMDGGCERPIGYGLTLPGDEAAQQRALARVRAIGALLTSIRAGEIVSGGGGADIGPLMRGGVPGLGFRTVGERYFDWHHTEADTLDKVEPENFRRAVASLGVMAYSLAEIPARLGD